MTGAGPSGYPATKELWFTDNGRDELGDDVPRDELNRAPKAGLHFGFPCCRDILDPDLGTGRDCGDYTAPAQLLGPHVAALGMRFYTGTMFPAEYRGQIFIAEHGSWNRSTPLGYRVSLVRLDGDQARGYEVFAGAGCAARATPGAAPSTSWSCRTARCWSPTTRPGSSTASTTAVRPQFPG